MNAEEMDEIDFILEWVMEHENAYTLMMDALDGELAGDHKEDLEAHLRACPTCTRECAQPGDWLHAKDIGSSAKPQIPGLVNQRPLCHVAVGRHLTDANRFLGCQ